MHLHFEAFLHDEMTQVVDIILFFYLLFIYGIGDTILKL